MRRTATPITLFDPPDAAYESRLQRFAREVAKRHRGRPSDVPALLAALRAYHATWSLFASVPVLDKAGIAVAVNAYHRARGISRRAAA
ncbi:MAG: hypothetical protein NVS2B8_15450 [Vulcanimicrobiaceae bacterium]